MILKPLSTLKKGETGVINRIEDGHLSLKLMEMGCIPGERISVDAISPFGDPIAIKITDYLLSMRIEDAKQIMIEFE